MSYPSLLFYGKAFGTKIEKHVFEDVKLTLFFSDEAINAMRVLCRPEDIPARQDFLRFLSENAEAAGTLVSLNEKIGQIYHLRSALDEVKCENERHYIFVGLMAGVADFVSQAAQMPEGGGILAERFHSRFQSLLADPDWTAFSEQALHLRELAREAERETFRMNGDNLWIRLEYGETYVERLERCARELGLPESRTKRDTSIRLDARMVNALARLHPESFLAFRDFYAAGKERFDETILSYRYELNYYLEARKLIRRIAEAGLPLCWPHVSDRRELRYQNVYDISLLTKDHVTIIPNDAEFSEEEPFFFLTGANGGGKTTFLRALAIATILFRSGCPVCAENASLFAVENVLTHFPQDERFDADGRYADELRRMDEILSVQNGASLILLNETFSTTNEELAVSSTLKVTEQLKSSGSFTLYITHQQGLEPAGVPFLSVLVDATDSNRRTYRIARRREAEGSYARDILRRYALDRESLQKRFGRAAEEAEA